MTTKLPVLTPRKLISALQKGGFIVDHQTGSHLSMSHPDFPERFAVIPLHKKDIMKGTLMSILKQARISKRELMGWLAHVPALNGLTTEGEIWEEVKFMVKDAIRGYLETLRKNNLPIPDNLEV